MGIIAAPAYAQDWPRLREPSSEQVCTKSLAFAEAAFRSNIPVVYATNTASKPLGLKVVIGPEGRDISGGHSLLIDAGAFEEVPAPTGRRRSLYWQRQPNHGLRFALAEYSFNWQGDWFELFAVPENVTPADLQAQADMQDEDDRSIQAIRPHGWRPPLLVQDAQTKEIWAIDVGEPYNFLADWDVYAIGPDGAKKRCVIQFKPDIAPPQFIGAAWDLLPTETRELAKLIDGTLGSGQNEGTLNPTARNRLAAAHTWANVAMRPWVFAGSDTAELRRNTRAFLKNWGQTAKSFGRHYRKIEKQYPLAEADLVTHYRQTFGMSEQEATATARAAIDTAVAANF